MEFGVKLNRRNKQRPGRTQLRFHRLAVCDGTKPYSTGQKFGPSADQTNQVALQLSNNSSPVILVYDPKWIWLKQPEVTGCRLTLDVNLFHEVDAVVFHVPTAPDLRNFAKRPGQVWVAWSMESEVFYPLLSNVEYMKRFDLTMTYRFDSDVPVPYFDATTRTAILNPPRPKTGRAPLVYINSNDFDKSGRLEYVRELMQYMPVDSYGKSLNNRPILEDHGRQTKLDIISTYKFTLAYENSRTRDYVTEKFYDPFEAGSVPVYLGAPNLADFVPGEHCYVDVDQFNGPRDLADYLLRAAADDIEYESYFAWKQQPLKKPFLDLVELISEEAFTRLARKLHAGAGCTDRGNDPVHKVARWLDRARESPPLPPLREPGGARNP